MTTVAEQIIQLKQNLDNSRQTVLLKGGSVGDTPAFNNLANEIESIPSGDANYVLVDDTDTAYRKNILAGADQYAKLKSLGGMTYKRHKPDGNLLPYPYIDNTDTQGTFIFNKISDDWLLYKTATLVDSTNAFKLPKGTYVLHLNHSVIEDSTQALYSPSGYVSINGNMEWVETGTGIPYATFTFDTETLISNIEVYMEWMVDMVVDNPTATGSISPVLYREGEAVAFTPRQMELVDTKVTAIRSYGANLFDIRTAKAESLYAGISSEVTNDILKITCTVASRSGFVKLGTLVAGTYTISATFTNLEGFYLYAGDDINNVASLGIYFTAGETRRFTLSESKTVWLCATFSNSVDYYTLSNVMLNLGTTAHPYKPYREPITYIIPEALQGSGKGVEGYSDTIDFERGKYIKRCETMVLNGGEAWLEWTSGTRFYYINNTVSAPNTATDFICSHFDYGSSDNKTGLYVQLKVIRAYVIPLFPTLDEWKAYLAEQYANDNPVTITYALAEPNEPNLTETIGTIFEIEEGGFLEFFNKHSNAVPSHISYLRRIV